VFQLPKEWQNDRLLAFFMRHVVPIYFDLRKDDERRHIIFTAFLFSVYDRWLLMTAGHCITNMQKWRAYGYEVVACRLLDGLGSNAKFKDHPVPFDYDEAQPIMLGIHETWDYGVLFPSDNTRALLEANGVVPFTEQSWEPLVEHFETFRLVGIPAELTVETTPQELSITMLFPRLIEEAQRPEGFEDTDAPMFYASLPPSNPLSGLEGLSGSPIIGLAFVEGQLRYWLHAMQVSALRGKYISGMLMRPLGKFLKEVCEGKHGNGGL